MKPWHAGTFPDAVAAPTATPQREKGKKRCPYQLDLLTPAIFPPDASSRNFMRDNLQNPCTPRPRPVSTQRLRVRVRELLRGILFSRRTECARKGAGVDTSFMMHCKRSRCHSCLANSIRRCRSRDMELDILLRSL